MGIVKAFRFPVDARWFGLDAEEVALLARKHCIVGRALEVPVHLRRVECRAASFAAESAA